MEYLATGVLKGPHGIQGFIKLHTYSQESDHLHRIGSVSLRKEGAERRVELETIRITGREILVKFKGIDNPEDARKYNGWEVWIPREQAAPLDDGEFYVADLAGLSLTVGGKRVGQIVGVIDGPQALLLEILSEADGKTHLVPFMARYVGTVDLERKEMELLAPELLG